MGSSKKHKEKDKSREHKKKHKHRSRSRSRDRQERKHKHRDRSRDRDSKKRRRDDSYDRVETHGDYSNHDHGHAQIPGLRDYRETDDNYPPPSRHEHHRAPHGHGEHYEDGEIPTAQEPVVKTETGLEFAPESSSSGAAASSGAGAESLSVGDTNKLRAKLGLKPLDVPSDSKDGVKTEKSDDVHAPPTNLSDIRKQKELKERLMVAKEKRKINQKLGKIKALGDESDDDDALSWVKKMKKKETEKKLAEKRAKLLEEMDEEFGISSLVNEEFGVKKTEYTARDLRGLRVQHGQSQFKEGQTVILTLQDRPVLEDKDEEVLVNVNMEQDEKYAENVKNKKLKPDYKPYDEPEYDDLGMVKPKEILDKYNEEIDGKKKEEFTIGKGGRYSADHERIMAQMKADIQAQGQTLSLPAPNIMGEYYTEAEMSSFKKVKKKVRKIRKKPKMLRADDLLPLADAARSQAAPIDSSLADKIDKSGPIPGLDMVDMVEPDSDIDDTAAGPDLTGVALEDEAGAELERVLQKTRRIKTQPASAEQFVAERVIAEAPMDEEDEEEEEDEEADALLSLPVKRAPVDRSNIILNQTSEFCRALGEIPTYGQAGNRMVQDDDDIMDFEQDYDAERRARQQEEEDEENPGWQQVEIDTAPVEIDKEEKAVLDDEPVVGAGIAAALELASKKGYLVEEQSKKTATQRNVSTLQADNYSIEDKRYDDLDEKYRKRDRYAGGMVSDFSDKDGYKPDVRLDYVDDTGRMMSPKEAFRYLSHRFHGKGSGKMKTEKRKKKIEEEQLMKSMSSTDTPLGTASMLEEKLEKERTPYLVLSGGNKTLTSADRLTK